ncbi:glycoside hydrolase family 32 protein [Halobacillus sp. Marseille-Q1614]|uniref:glycoside hydrolase family 32 protein n=1 Tax=Halobacillus sp. Marseille-Q1614 TaxID=2709134 RepID=UPI00156EB577|nr:glycoside hydrolase family 32 protein [Halobacillus sp. Marseille-Q1614]
MTITNVKHSKQIDRAMEAIEEEKKGLDQAQYRLNYHFMAPANWINDPNGLIQHNGLYHLFYQHHPYSVDWGPMHWGHATSSDLINWQHESVALAPSEEYDYEEGNEDIGCFSGSAVSNGDEIALIYTGHVIGKSPKEVQAAAFSKDGVHFNKAEKNPVIKSPPEGLTEDFRDPKVWKHNGSWYMVVGSSINGNGAIPLYKSKDLLEWTYMGVALNGDAAQGDMWECPDLFPIGDKHMLVVSPMNMTDGKNIIMVGEMDYEKGKFIPESVKEIDEGDDFYAAQTFEDERGRRILIAWMDTWKTDFPTKDEGWAGAMTIPRQVVLRDDQKVKLLPVAEIEDLRENHTSYEPLHLSSNELVDINLQETLQHSYEIMINFNLTEANSSGRAGLQLRTSADGTERTEIYLNVKTKELIVDTTLSGEKSHKSIRKAKVDVENNLSLRIFVDTCSLEVCTTDGETWITQRIYPDPKSMGINVFTESTEVLIEEIQTWTLKKVID